MPRFPWRSRRPRPDGAAGAADEPVDEAPFVAVISGRTLVVGKGIRLRLHDRVPPAGSVPVVVPCCGNGSELDALVTPNGPAVLRYDVRSRGESDRVVEPRRIGFDVEVDDLRALCDAAGFERISILAWSYHAAVAVRFALDHPERVERLVLVAAVPTHGRAEPGRRLEPTPAQLARLDQLQADKLPKKDPAAWCAAWREVYVPLRLGRPDAYERMASVCHLPNEHPDHATRAVIVALTDLHPYDWRAELRSLAAPVLVVHGLADPDPIENAVEWVDRLPDARLLTIDDVGTAPWVEDPDRFFPTVNAFLRGASV